MSTMMTPAEAAEAGAKAVLSVDKGVSFGPFIMSLFADGVLSGIMFLQFCNWCLWSRKQERLFIKIIVYILAITGLAETVFTVVFNMHLFVYNYGNYATFLATTWLGWPPFMDCVIGTICQLVYVDRAFRLNNRNKLIPIIAGLLMLAALAGGVGTVISFINLTSELQAGQIYVYVGLYLAAMITVDVLIVACVGYGLWKSKTGWSHTDALVQKLIVLSLETQLAPTAISFAFLILYVVSPATTINFFFVTILSKVYSVGLYAVLNSRHELRRPGGTEQAWLKGPNTYALSNDRPHQATVNITEDTFVRSTSNDGSKRGLNRVPGGHSDIGNFEKTLDDDINLDYSINHSSTGLTASPTRYEQENA